MITDACQRWLLGREFRRPAGETIRTSEYDVEKLGPVEAKAFVEAHHYSGSCSPPAHPFALYRHGNLSGVAVFGPLCSENAHKAVFPTLTSKEGVTLGRLVLLDNVPGNGESYFIARAFKLLAADGVVAVESCADPEPRSTVDGRRVHKGHCGGIYQATNGKYIGKTNPASLRLLPDGTVFSNRSSGKVVRAEQGRVYAGAELVAWGADPLRNEEDPLEWVRYWRTRLTRPMRHQGNHRYVWCLDKRKRYEVLDRHTALPYPKIGWT